MLNIYQVILAKPDRHWHRVPFLLLLISLINLSTPKFIQVQGLSQHYQRLVTALYLSDDHQLIFTGASDGMVRVFTYSSLLGYNLRQVLSEANGIISSLLVSANKSTLVTSSHDGFIRVYNRKTEFSFQLVQSIYVSREGVRSMGMDSSASRLVAGTYGTTNVYQHDGQKFALVQSITSSPKAMIESSSISRDGSLLVLKTDTATEDALVYRFQKTQFSELQHLNGSSLASALAISQDGEWIVAGNNMYRFQKTQNTFSFVQRIKGLCDTPAKLLLADQVLYGVCGSQTFVAGLHSGGFDKPYSVDESLSSEVTGLFVTTDSSYLAVGDVNGLVKVYKSCLLNLPFLRVCLGSELHSIKINTKNISAVGAILAIAAFMYLAFERKKRQDAKEASRHRMHQIESDSIQLTDCEHIN